MADATIKTYKQDETGRKVGGQLILANKFAMSIRDACPEKGLSASYLTKYFTLSTLRAISADLDNGVDIIIE